MSLGCALQRRIIDREIISEVIADLDLEALQARTSLARRQEEDGEQAVPAFASVMSTPSMLAAWVPKFIAVCAILIVLGAALFQGHRWMTAKTVVHANRMLPPPISTRSPSSNAQQPQRAVQANTVQVKAGQSLYQICIKNFGCYNSERVQEIQKLNPWLRNLDHIESGQRIRIPAVGATLQPHAKRYRAVWECFTRRKKQTMSRNFDLMQQLEIDRGPHPSETVAPVFPTSPENAAAMAMSSGPAMKR